MKPSLKSSSTIYNYVKVQQLDDICQIGDKKQTRQQNMVEIVFWWGGGGGGGGVK